MAEDSPRSRTPVNPWVLRALVVLCLGLVVYALLGTSTRRYFEQRSEVADRRAQLADIRSRNEEMERRLRRLDDPEEIQRIARRDYGLVTEGEESYTILPSATAGLNLPNGWPFGTLSESVERASAGKS